MAKALGKEIQARSEFTKSLKSKEAKVSDDQKTIMKPTQNPKEIPMRELMQRNLQAKYGNLLEAIESHCQATLDTKKAMKMIRKSYKLLKVKK